VTIDRIRLHRIEVPLVRPFRTSFGTETMRDLVLVEAIDGEGRSGWGECVAMDWPGYSAEYTDGAIDVIGRHLLPALAGISQSTDPEDIRRGMRPVLGHPMAKAALETALLDLWLRRREQSLADYLGAVTDRVDCGVSVGIPASETLAELMDEVQTYVEAGYRRIKLKIEPGWDVAPVAAVRERWPSMPLQVDANQAFHREDGPVLAQLDGYDLLLIEQPLPEDDWYGHVLLARQLRTPICMDESILSVVSADSAISLGATSVINIKPGRVGGYLTARDIHDLCRRRGIPVWCGGMLETGIGRAANLALAAMPGFTLPGDTSASDRYYARDVTAPFVLDDGQLPVPTGSGIGVDPIPEVLAEMTTWTADLVVGA
jgi:O-succinylbenzoate synthase